ncbi:hypothetical protein NHQ30_004053 [Ciborinia camelliae]|nr:hypothetical protein NHQ30_004053 [Ciborinia camelliae]
MPIDTKPSNDISTDFEAGSTTASGTFPQFSSLPAEVRDLIWDEVCLQPRIIPFELYLDNYGRRPRQPYHLLFRIPAVLHTSSQSRERALNKHYSLIPWSLQYGCPIIRRDAEFPRYSPDIIWRFKYLSFQLYKPLESIFRSDVSEYLRAADPGIIDWKKYPTLPELRKRVRFMAVNLPDKIWTRNLMEIVTGMGNSNEYPNLEKVWLCVGKNEWERSQLRDISELYEIKEDREEDSANQSLKRCIRACKRAFGKKVCGGDDFRDRLQELYSYRSGWRKLCEKDGVSSKTPKVGFGVVGDALG